MKFMKGLLKKNQVIIYVIALMLVTAGYLNYTTNTAEQVSAQTTMEMEANDDMQIADVGDATLVNSEAVSENEVEENATADTTNTMADTNMTQDDNTTENSTANTVAQTSATVTTDEYFTKSKLTNASRIVVVNDLDLFEKYDSSGGRYMGFVWYQPNDGADFRLLNLEIVEQGYSLNLLNQNSQILDGYYEAFQEAQEAAKGRRVNGEKDCDFDSSGEVVETTISNAKENFDTLGVNDSTGNSGKQLRIIGQVIAISGSDFYVRDVNPSDEDVVPASIFAFTQYKSSGVKVGDIVRFYAKITKYYGNLQLTDVKLNNDHYPFEILATTKEEAEELGYVYNVDPVYMDPSLITSTDSFEPYAGNLVRTTITIEDSEDFVYQSQTDSSTFTIHATCNGIELNIRCEGHNFFSSESTIRTVFERGKSYDVNVLLGIFQYNDSEEVSYQIEFPFFKASEYKNYISEHIN